MFHQSCKTLPYGIFIRIIVDGDLFLLSISGKPKLQDLEQAWEEILTEYSELIITDKSSNITSLFNKICFYNWKRDNLELLLKFLRREYDKDVAEWVCNLGYDLITDTDDRLKQIDAIEMEAKNLVVLLNQCHNEYNLLYKKPDEDGYKKTEMDYEVELSVLSRFYGSRIDKNKFTVFEVCAVINDLIKEQKKKSKTYAS